MPVKYENTKKAKAQADKMSTEIAKKLGYDSPKTKTAPTPKSTATKKPEISAEEKRVKAYQDRNTASKMTPKQKSDYLANSGRSNY